MNETLIEKIEARHSKSKTWHLSNKETGHFLDVIFNIDLERKMRTHRNFSFSRFESEQLNELMRMVPSLKNDYQLLIDQQTVGLAYLPLDHDKAKALLQQIG